jgi:hypothetical protein
MQVIKLWQANEGANGRADISIEPVNVIRNPQIGSKFVYILLASPSSEDQVQENSDIERTANSEPTGICESRIVQRDNCLSIRLATFPVSSSPSLFRQSIGIHCRNSDGGHSMEGFSPCSAAPVSVPPSSIPLHHRSIRPPGAASYFRSATEAARPRLLTRSVLMTFANISK